MAHSKLHIICGNCGDNTMMTFHIDPEGLDVSDGDETKYEPTVIISCGNCSTIHNLSDNVPMEKTK